MRNQFVNIFTPLSQEEHRTKQACTAKLKNFIKHGWPYVCPESPFIPDWHIDAMAEHLEALFYLQIRDLIMNVPPRCGKSLVAILFNVWCWVQDPSFSTLAVSYGEKLSLRFNRRARDVVLSPWFQRFWGSDFKMTQLSAGLLENNKGGFRMASTVEGGNLGHGARLQQLDDPNNIATINSFVAREEAKYFLDSVLPTRYASLDERRKLLIQQRLHVHDLSGYKMSFEKNNITHLCLPGEFEAKRRCTTIILPGTTEPWCDPRTEEGELIGPYKRSPVMYEEVKNDDMKGNKAAISAQIQQVPLLSEDLRLNPEWFKWWVAPGLPEFDYIIQSWDTALTTNAKSAYSACTTWGAFKRDNDVYHIMLLNLWAEKQEYPMLRKSAQLLAEEYMPDKIVVESKVNGYSMKDDLNSIGLPAVGFNPNRYGNKEARCSVISAFIEAGFVWVPTQQDSAAYLTRSGQRLLAAAATYPAASPGSDTADIIDSMSQGLIVLGNMGYLTNREPYYPELALHGEREYDAR